MARYSMAGFIGPGATITIGLRVWTTLNREGDWGQLYMQAHPRSADVLLRSDPHAKRWEVGSDGYLRYTYYLTATNLSTTSTGWDIDM